jgi:tetratricopeptide (TPR) repeat protein
VVQHKENEVPEGPVIDPTETPFAEMFQKFNLNDYKKFHTTECLATFAWEHILSPPTHILRVMEYLHGPCPCLHEQHCADHPSITFEERTAEALHALRKGDPTKVQALFLKTVAKKEAEIKAAFREAAVALRHHAAVVRLSDPEGAVALYRKATEYDPDNVHGWILLRTLLYQLGYNKQAEDISRTMDESRKEDN